MIKLIGFKIYLTNWSCKGSSSTHTLLEQLKSWLTFKAYIALQVFRLIVLSCCPPFLYKIIIFSVMNSYHEFTCMKSDSWIQIGYCESVYLNSYTYEFIYEFKIYTFEFKYMNSCIHFIYEIISYHIYEIICIWYDMISYNHFIYVLVKWLYEFMCIWMNSHMNSCKLWIHMIFSYLNS